MEPRESLGREEGPSPRRRLVYVASFVALLVAGVVLFVVASLPQETGREVAVFQGVVPGFSTEAVPEAAYRGAGFAHARAPDLRCGVSVHFLSVNDWVRYNATQQLPTPQLHCQQGEATLPGSVATVFVQNEREGSAAWEFELERVDFDRPFAGYGLVAIPLLLLGGLGVAAYAFQRQLLGWLEEQVEGEKEKE